MLQTESFREIEEKTFSLSGCYVALTTWKRERKISKGHGLVWHAMAWSIRRDITTSRLTWCKRWFKFYRYQLIHHRASRTMNTTSAASPAHRQDSDGNCELTLALVPEFAARVSRKRGPSAFLMRLAQDATNAS